jgi:hypothetical protein
MLNIRHCRKLKVSTNSNPYLMLHTESKTKKKLAFAKFLQGSGVGAFLLHQEILIKDANFSFKLNIAIVSGA